MRELYGTIAFVLIIIGTAGLLVNEFVIDCGRAIAMVFAVLNIAGLVILFIELSRMRKGG